MGNTLERGVGCTPYGGTALHLTPPFPPLPQLTLTDHWMVHCGKKVTFPCDELMRTGMGAIPQNTKGGSKHNHEDEANKSWHLFPYGFGPYNDSLFSEDDLRICTKMGGLEYAPWSVMSDMSPYKLNSCRTLADAKHVL